MAHPVAQALARISRELNTKFYERSTVIEALVLGLLARQNVFILGAPGTAKSELVTDFQSRITGANRCSFLLSRTRPAEAVLGPMRMRLMREEDRFERNVQGYLPTAHLAMLDEIGKMGPVLGHDLLAILNEHVFHEVRPTGDVHAVPLISAVGASNESLREQGDDAAALWDRMLVRTQVSYIQDTTNFLDFIEGSVTPASDMVPTTVDLDALQDATQVVRAVAMPHDVAEAILGLRVQLEQEESKTFSDRRWRQSVRLMQAAAFMAGRDQLELDDVQALRHTLWEEPKDLPALTRIVTGVSNPLLTRVMERQEEIATFSAEVDRYEGRATKEKAQAASDILGKCKQIEDELAEIRATCVEQKRSTTKVDDAIDDLATLRKKARKDLMDVS